MLLRHFSCAKLPRRCLSAFSFAISRYFCGNFHILLLGVSRTLALLVCIYCLFFILFFLYRSLSSFSQNVDFLPHSLTHLILGDYFNQPVDHLPPKLVLAIFGDDFHQPLDHLPSSLKTLSTGRKFNYPIDFLPPSLTGNKKEKRKYKKKRTRERNLITRGFLYMPSQNGNSVIKLTLRAALS